MNCPVCGAEVAGKSVYCQKCGERIGYDETLATKADEPSSAGETGSPAERIRKAAGGPSSGQNDDKERVLWEGGYSSKGMIGGWILGVVGSVVLAVVAFLLIASGILWVIPLVVILLVWIGLGVMLMLRKLSVSYELTTQRFLHRIGILSRKTDRIEVIDIDDVSFEQGLLQRMVGVGSIHIVSSDRSHPELMLHGIDNVEEVANLIDETRRGERRRRGLHIEAI